MSRLVSLALALLASGCGRGADVTLRPAPELAEVTADASALWAPVLARCGRQFTTTADDPDATIAYGHAQGALGDTYTPDLGARPIRVYLNRDAIGDNPALLRQALAHELGHVLGAPESDRPGDLMYPYREEAGTVPTPHDAELIGCRQ